MKFLICKTIRYYDCDYDFDYDYDYLLLQKKKKMNEDSELRYCRKLTYANNALCSLSLGDNGVSVFPQ